LNAPPAPPSASAATLDELAARLAEFARERDWDQFHSPKNLAMALAGEVGELLEHFQWLTEQQSRELAPETREAVALELADVLLYLVRLSDQLGIDVTAAAQDRAECREVPRRAVPWQRAKVRRPRLTLARCGPCCRAPSSCSAWSRC
jgi:NTP pyrophosphatase (non-canonical NTP hydrolase)